LKERESVYGDDADFLIFLLLCTPALAHDPSHPELNEWFNRLASGKGLCCSFADGVVVSDVDWESRGRALEAAKTRQVEAGILLSSPLVFSTSKQISELALANRLPLISLFGEFSKAGSFMAYGPNINSLWQRAGVYVGKILQGAKPNDLPIQRPEKFDLVINLKTAEALGLSVPPMLLARADEMIE
jgi:ABC-type uncharacterized transport system substrate-binding protein